MPNELRFVRYVLGCGMPVLPFLGDKATFSFLRKILDYLHFMEFVGLAEVNGKNSQHKMLIIDNECYVNQ